MATGFVVAFAHAAIPTHWLPFVLAGRGQRWSKLKTLGVVGFCGIGHVLFTTVLGALVVWIGIETSRWTGDVFPWIAGGALILFGLYYLVRQWRGEGHGHHHFGGGHDHGPGAEGHADDDGHRHDDKPAAHHAHGRAQGHDHPHDHGHKHDHGHDHGHKHGHRHDGHSHPPHGATKTAAPAAAAKAASARSAKSDGAVILSLFMLLTFSPCEGFLPVYLSGIQYGWMGFILLSAVLAAATVGGMVVFTWLTMTGMERLRLEFLERYESGILGAVIIFLGIGIIFLGF